jgi:hypothetical protein
MVSKSTSIARAGGTSAANTAVLRRAVIAGAAATLASGTRNRQMRSVSALVNPATAATAIGRPSPRPVRDHLSP